MSNSRSWPHIAQHGILINRKHTWRDWSMVPKEIPVINPPAAKTMYQELPGVSGAVDFTDALYDVAYENRKGSFIFIVLDDLAWPIAYSSVMKECHGQKCTVILDDDPSYCYSGRLFVNQWKSNRKHSEIVIDYDLDPYKYSVDSTGGYDWLWNDLFNNTIFYGYFDVKGSMARTLINPSASPVVPEFNCSTKMTVTFGGFKFQLPKGKSRNHGILLEPGDNRMTFSGTGRVAVDYTGNKQL